MLTGERCRTIVTYRALQQNPTSVLRVARINKAFNIGRGVPATHGFAFLRPLSCKLRRGHYFEASAARQREKTDFQLLAPV